MSEIPIGVAALEGMVLTVLTHLNSGEGDDTVTRFVNKFRLKVSRRAALLSLQGPPSCRTDKGMITDCWVEL